MVVLCEVENTAVLWVLWDTRGFYVRVWIYLSCSSMQHVFSVMCDY